MSIKYQVSSIRNLRRAYILCLISCVLCLNSLLAQQNLLLNREWGLSYEKGKNAMEQKFKKSDTTYGAGVNFVKINYVVVDKSCFRPYICPISYKEKDKSKSLLYRKLKKESLFIVNDSADKFHLAIDPLLNF